MQSLKNNYSKTNPIKIVILCGGRGSRLGPITKNIPKPLVKVRNLSIIEHKINYYKSSGFHNYVFCIGYKGHMIEKKVTDLGIKAEISDSGIKPGILHRLNNAKNYLSKPSIISYGDTFAQLNFQKLLKFHNKSGSLITLVIASIAHPFGLIEVSNKSKVVEFHEKPILNHFIGYSVIEPSFFDKIPKSYISQPDGKGLVKAIQFLAKKDLVSAFSFSGLQITINTSEELHIANEKIGNYYTIKEKK